MRVCTLSRYESMQSMQEWEYASTHNMQVWQFACECAEYHASLRVCKYAEYSGMRVCRICIVVCRACKFERMQVWGYPAPYAFKSMQVWEKPLFKHQAARQQEQQLLIQLHNDHNIIIIIIIYFAASPAFTNQIPPLPSATRSTDSHLEETRKDD